MKNIFWTILFLGISNFHIYAQYSDDFGVAPLGSMITLRNLPDIEAIKNSTIIQCRKSLTIPLIFDDQIYHDNSKRINPIIKEYEELTYEDKVNLCILAWNTKEKKYYDKVIGIALSDTSKDLKGIRWRSIECLSVYNTDTAKKVLSLLLTDKDKEVVIRSALSLVQLGINDISLEYINKYYQVLQIKDVIHTALMIINSNEAILLLKKMADDSDPSNALDALAALSLLGECDFAFTGFSLYAKHNFSLVRIKAAWCLAYYTGTKKAFEIIKNMQKDDDNDVRIEVKKILSNYKL